MTMTFADHHPVAAGFAALLGLAVIAGALPHLVTPPPPSAAAECARSDGHVVYLGTGTYCTFRLED